MFGKQATRRSKAAVSTSGSSKPTTKRKPAKPLKITSTKRRIHVTASQLTQTTPATPSLTLTTPQTTTKTSIHRRTFSSPTSKAFKPTRSLFGPPQSGTDKFGDTWTRQAKALGYPSRAVFKLIQAQKKFKILQPGDVVVDLGCSPGSWSKLSSTIVSGNGFVLGMDLTTLSPSEQTSIGVRHGDINRRFEYPKSYDNGSTAGGLLASERKLLRSRSPVGYMQQDVTEWTPGPGFQHEVDVILSDMAPNTTGVPSVDSASSIDLCYSVVELCSQLFKAPSTKIEKLSGPAERQRAIQKLKSDPNHENILVDHLTDQFNKNMQKHYGDGASAQQTNFDHNEHGENDAASGFLSASKDKNGKAVIQHSNNRINLKMIKKTLKQHVYLQKPNAIGIADTDEASAIYKTNERTLSQIRGDEHISTTWRGTLMMKVFQGEGMTDLMNILKQIFVSTYTYKPESSRSESVEIFIICKGYCGPFDHTRITNKHIRRPKTEEYLRSYTSNNRKRPQLPHDPTKSPKYYVGFSPDNPVSKPAIYDPRSVPNKNDPRRKMSLQELYAQASGGASASYTSDGFKDQEREQQDQEAHFDQIQRTIASGVTTNVHSAIKNTASLEQGAMSPLQREISESDDMLVFRREQFDRLYDRDRIVNQVPDTDALIKSMSLFWDEGINFAKKMAIESQSPTRVDIFAQKAIFADQIKQDEVSSILDDLHAQSSSVVTASSIMKEHQKNKRKTKAESKSVPAGGADANPITTNLKKKATKLVSQIVPDEDEDLIPTNTSIETEKRKRGRSPRAAAVVVETSVAAVVPAEVKKRGRKAAVTAAVAKEPAEVKKLGRKAAVVAEEPAAVQEPNATKTKAAAVKKTKALEPEPTTKKTTKTITKTTKEVITEPEATPAKATKKATKKLAVPPVQEEAPTKPVKATRAKKTVVVPAQDEVPVPSAPVKVTKAKKTTVAEMVPEPVVTAPKTTRGRKKGESIGIEVLPPVDVQETVKKRGRPAATTKM